MPFSSSTGYSFTENGILAYAPRRSGVYGIYKNGQWIYIGESQDIEGRLFEHLRAQSDQSACILGHSPTHFVCETCDAMTRVVREQALIREFSPICNR